MYVNIWPLVVYVVVMVVGLEVYRRNRNDDAIVWGSGVIIAGYGGAEVALRVVRMLG